MHRGNHDTLLRQPNHPATGDRRRRRSNDPLVALGHLLEAARRSQGYSALAIADKSGLLVAGSGHFAECEELAAHAPLKRRADEAQSTPGAVEALSIDGIEVLIAGAPTNSPGLCSVAAGCARILGRRRPELPLGL